MRGLDLGKVKEIGRRFGSLVKMELHRDAEAMTDNVRFCLCQMYLSMRPLTAGMVGNGG